MLTTDNRLEGKRALVTGGSKGIGLAVAAGLYNAGAELVLVARDQQGLAEAQAALDKYGRGIVTRPFDMGQVKAIPEFYQQLVQDAGTVDILINNAGTTRRGLAHELTLDEWDQVIAVNLSAVFALCRAFAQERIASDRPGKIVNIASVMSEAIRAGTAPYTASKGAIRQLTTALALDWAPNGINVNAIGPGFIKIPLTQPLQDTPEFDAWVRERTPLGRWGRPEDVAGLAAFLASDAADFITGQTFYADGGLLSML